LTLYFMEQAKVERTRELLQMGMLTNVLLNRINK